MLAARAAASFVLANESNTALLKHFADLLPGILQVGPSPPGPMGFIHFCVDNARLNYNQQQQVSHHIIMLDMLNLSCFLIKLHCDSDIECQRLSTLVFLLLMDNFCNINPTCLSLNRRCMTRATREMILCSSRWSKSQTRPQNTWGPTWRLLCSSVWRWVSERSLLCKQIHFALEV